MKGDKQEIIVKGRIIKMGPLAAKITLKHFGGSKNYPANKKFLPKELLNIPKLPIIPAVKVVKETIKDADSIVEPEVVIVPAEEVKEVDETVEVKEVKRTRKPRK